jgi:hypothetical protein
MKRIVIREILTLFIVGLVIIPMFLSCVPLPAQVSNVLSDEHRR